VRCLALADTVANAGREQQVVSAPAGAAAGAAATGAAGVCTAGGGGAAATGAAGVVAGVASAAGSFSLISRAGRRRDIWNRDLNPKLSEHPPAESCPLSRVAQRREPRGHRQGGLEELGCQGSRAMNSPH
jgi:hypothetical protein